MIAYSATAAAVASRKYSRDSGGERVVKPSPASFLHCNTRGQSAVRDLQNAVADLLGKHQLRIGGHLEQGLVVA